MWSRRVEMPIMSQDIQHQEKNHLPFKSSLQGKALHMSFVHLQFLQDGKHAAT